MRSSGVLALLSAAFAAKVHASSPLYALGLAPFTGSRCGSTNPPLALLEDARLDPADDVTASTLGAAKSIAVKTYVHIVTTPASANNFTQRMVDDQLRAMNAAYNPLSISFALVNTSRTVNAAWAAAATDADERAMKAALRRGSYADLNLYFLSDLGGGLLGFCYFPETLSGLGSNGPDTLLLDGCINLAGSLPGGPVANYDQGKTAVHETGHWFGVFHVFQGDSCLGAGDFVADTPAQKNATRGCPVGADSCPGRRGLDSITNFMDYSYDACMTEFTQGQKKRMFRSYKKYRAGK
ncbi:hypothetical protein FH972_026242 [Carpinus fangiana]|uniref:Peptidase M43 pregnancy-associated plasma-A domain-containing protein n=1 Tax=Carpinus fangiana TaxID=176857 RepID=A0A5N6L3K6_9ROSI|nr:hypothetical protein FH972_026242 [Carpinus fangiana]